MESFSSRYFIINLSLLRVARCRFRDDNQTNLKSNASVICTLSSDFRLLSSVICLLHPDKKHEKGRDNKYGKNGRNRQPPEHHASQPPVKFGSRTGNQNQGKNAEYAGRGT